MEGQGETKDKRRAIGGFARARALSKAQRIEIARKGGQARWGGPRAIRDGILSIGGAEIACYVVQTDEQIERVLSTRGIMRSLNRAWRGRKYTGTELPVFLEASNLKPFISADLGPVLSPVFFLTDKGAKAEGFRAQILPAVCEVYLRARDADVLTEPQKIIARQCEILVRGLSRVGIIAMVDEAAGYQDERPADELRRILEAYINEELRPWVKRFPNEFFKQIYRLHGWDYREGNHKHPQYVGKLINKLIYDALPPGVLAALREKNPTNESGRRRWKHHQLLTGDIGEPHLERQITAVTTLARAVDGDKELFSKLYGKAFPNAGRSLEGVEGQLTLNLFEGSPT